MIGQGVIAVILLLHIQNTNAQCTTPEMRTALLDEALAALECENFTCGKFSACIMILYDIISIATKFLQPSRKRK